MMHKLMIDDEVMHRRRILSLHWVRVIPDADLALLYGVDIKRLKAQIRRHRERFCDDFIFQLTQKRRQQ